jgi:protein gp37
MSEIDGKWWSTPWNPIHVKGGGWHCTKISSGCDHCWAEGVNIRFGNGFGFLHGSSKMVEFVLDQRILEQPLHWKKPRIVAVQWLGDLGHEQIPDLFIKNIIFASEAYNWHKYYFLQNA